MGQHKNGETDSHTPNNGQDSPDPSGRDGPAPLAEEYPFEVRIKRTKRLSTCKSVDGPIDGSIDVKEPTCDGSEDCPDLFHRTCPHPGHGKDRPRELQLRFPA